ncbi:MAG: hypothetical protein KatS3mg061_3601 [Dehalococcoidia bacterium]|nr:MAG: hypothetical protein KatS3mg061_3601 [Dehalococcoidia bacterium]
MRVVWFEVGLAAFAFLCAAVLGAILPQEDPTTWGALTAALFLGRLVLR